MFVDTAVIKVKAGSGGNGAVSFHRDKFTASGGPDGGNGGNGGNVIFKANRNLSTLSNFRHKKNYRAENGKDGSSAKRTGRSGEDLVIDVPPGTVLIDDSDGAIIADITEDLPVIIAKGGKGGAGNINFCNSVRQTPRFAKPGMPGEEFTLRLELKLLADVAIVGYPNVGKSTLISVVSQAKPQIANYHFTTLSPILGVVNYNQDLSFVVADIPGLIEGAFKGVGLGHQFLRHIERCRAIIHMVDVSGSEGRNPIDDFKIIRQELFKYDADLSKRPCIVVGNKCDIATKGQVQNFSEYVRGEGYKFFPISAVSREGISSLLGNVAKMLLELPPITVFKPNKIYESPLDLPIEEEIEIRHEENVYVVESKKLGRLVNSINFDDYNSLQYFQGILAKYGIISFLKKLGLKEGDTVDVCGIEFDFFE